MTFSGSRIRQPRRQLAARIRNLSLDPSGIAAAEIAPEKKHASHYDQKQQGQRQRETKFARRGARLAGRAVWVLQILLHISLSIQSGTSPGWLRAGSEEGVSHGNRHAANDQ